MKLDKKAIAKLRILKSGLIIPFENPEECAENLFGIQAQVQQFGEISILNRVKELKAEALTQLYEEHRLIKIWGQRMTVHMYSANDWKTVHQVYSNRNNFVKKGWEANRSVFDTLISRIENMTRNRIVDKKEITDLIESTAPHITDQYRDYSVLLQATLDGILFGIPLNPQTKHFAHRNMCIKDEEFMSWSENKESAFEHILKNYFRFYGPATLSDFCHWSGLAQKEITTALKNIEKELNVFTSEEKKYYSIGNDDELLNTKITKVMLLGKFDPLFVAYSDKTWIADPIRQKAIWRPAGHVEAVLLVNGELTGTWRYITKGNKMNFDFQLFRSVTFAKKRQTEREAEKIAGFLGKKIHEIRYNE